MQTWDLTDHSKNIVQERWVEQAVQTFAGRVRSSRKARGLSQADAAERAGISQSHWSKIERGSVEPSIGQVLRIQHVLSAPSIETFLGRFPSARLLESGEGERDVEEAGSQA